METGQLKHIPPFREVSAPRLSRMMSKALQEQYEKGAVLFRQGSPADAVWIILEGWVHLVRSEREDGSHAVVISTITPREVLCGISAVESGAYTLSAVAATNCVAVRIPGDLFHEVLKQEAGFAYEVLRLYARRILGIAEQFGSMAESVSTRITRSILRLQRQFGPTVSVTHRELAQMSWTTTESAIRIVRRLKRQGLVTGTRGRLTVSRPDRLEQLLAQTNGRGSA